MARLNVIQPFPPGMIADLADAKPVALERRAPALPDKAAELEERRQALITQLKRLKTRSHRRVELLAKLREVTAAQLRLGRR